jgi:hypothetical protein
MTGLCADLELFSGEVVHRHPGAVHMLTNVGTPPIRLAWSS